MKYNIISLYFIALSFFITTTPASAHRMDNTPVPITINLWEGKNPADNGLSPEGESFKNGFLSLSATSELYIYPAENPNGTIIMMCPGGGYYGLAMNHEGKDMAGWFNKKGITYAVLKYRMPNAHKEIPLSDAEEAIDYLRTHASEWGGNPKSVGVMGASAGGHLASTLATKYSSVKYRPDFQILFYPVISMDEKITHAGSRNLLLGKNPSSEDIHAYSNDLNINNNTPPAFLMLSSDDTVVPPENSIRYFKALIENNVSAAMYIYPTGGHGWGFNDSFTYKENWMQELDKWLRQEVITKGN